MTMPRSRNAAPVIRRGPPNRPAQPLVHRDSPSVGMGSKGILAGTRHRWRRGCWPRRRVPQQLAPACPGSPRKQMSGACFRRWGSGRGRYPAGKHVPQRDGDLELAGASGLSARHLRRLSPGSGIHCAADVRQMQTPGARVAQVARVRRRPQASITVHHRSSGSKM